MHSVQVTVKIDIRALKQIVCVLSVQSNRLVVRVKTKEIRFSLVECVCDVENQPDDAKRIFNDANILVLFSTTSSCSTQIQIGSQVTIYPPW